MPKYTRPLLVAFSLLLLAFLSGCSKPAYQNVSNEELKALLQQGVPLVDIRTPREWAETGTIPGSHKLTFFKEDGSINADFQSGFDALLGGKDKAVALICRTGNRTKTLAGYLSEKLGYTRIYNVTDGITSWIRDKNQLVR